MFNYSFKNKQRGFTLVELLVVIAILGTLLTIGLINYRKATEVTALNTDTETLASILREARTKALAGDRSGLPGITASDEIKALGIYFNDEKSFTFFADKNNNGSLDSGAGEELKKVALSNKVKIAENGCIQNSGGTDIATSCVGKNFVFFATGGQYVESGVIKLTLSDDLTRDKCIKISKETGKIETGECGADFIPLICEPEEYFCDGLTIKHKSYVISTGSCVKNTEEITTCAGIDGTSYCDESDRRCVPNNICVSGYGTCQTGEPSCDFCPSGEICSGGSCIIPTIDGVCGSADGKTFISYSNNLTETIRAGYDLCSSSISPIPSEPVINSSGLAWDWICPGSTSDRDAHCSSIRSLPSLCGVYDESATDHYANGGDFNAVQSDTQLNSQVLLSPLYSSWNYRLCFNRSDIGAVPSDPIITIDRDDDHRDNYWFWTCSDGIRSDPCSAMRSVDGKCSEAVESRDFYYTRDLYDSFGELTFPSMSELSPRSECTSGVPDGLTAQVSGWYFSCGGIHSGSPDTGEDEDFDGGQNCFAKRAWCGDNITQTEYEAYDTGVNNGINICEGADIPYGDFCYWASGDCSIKNEVRGPYCGDGSIDSSREQCENDTNCPSGKICSGCSCIDRPACKLQIHVHGDYIDPGRDFISIQGILAGGSIPARTDIYPTPLNASGLLGGVSTIDLESGTTFSIQNNNPAPLRLSSFNPSTYLVGNNYECNHISGNSNPDIIIDAYFYHQLSVSVNNPAGGIIVETRPGYISPYTPWVGQINCGRSYTSCIGNYNYRDTRSSGSPRYFLPASVILSANSNADDSYFFGGWGLGSCNGTSRNVSCSLNMNQDRIDSSTNVTANFYNSILTINRAAETGHSGAEDHVIVNGSEDIDGVNINCGGTPNVCSGNYLPGIYVQLTATFDPGYEISSWETTGASLSACSPATANCRTIRFTDGSGPTTVTVKVKKIAYNFNLELYNSRSGYKFFTMGSPNGYIEFGSINASTGRFVSNGIICSASGQVFKVCPTYTAFYGDPIVIRASDSAILQPISGGSNINQILTAMIPTGFSGSVGEINCDTTTKICQFHILGSGRNIRINW